MIVSLMSTMVNFFKLLFGFKLEMRKELNNKIIHIQDRDYMVFRHIAVKENKNKGSTVLVLKFQFYHNSLKLDRIVSFFQIPVFMGMTGFQEKLWTYDNDNHYFQGIYQWKSLKCADDYLKSYAVNYVKRKAKKNTVTSMIYENIDLNSFLIAQAEQNSIM